MSDGLFNKGKIFNAGFTEITKLWRFDCVILHDVDLLPENDYNTYSCGIRGPIHLGLRLDRVGYTLVSLLLALHDFPYL